MVSQLDMLTFIARLISILNNWLVDYHYFCSEEYDDIVNTYNRIIHEISPKSMINQLIISSPLFDSFHCGYSAVVDTV